VRRGPALAGAGVQDREVDLALVRVEVEEQLVRLVHHLLDPGIRAVHLVDHEDDRQPALERLAQHEPGLRQRPLAGVHEQEYTVHHGQSALHLAAEIGVARGVDDVDRHAGLARGYVAHRGVLGQDRDALLPLQVHRVEHAIGHLGARMPCAGLPQHGVDQRGLAVVDVGDDRDVAQVGADRHAFILAGR
jgi:hypothetical protein